MNKEHVLKQIRCPLMSQVVINTKKGDFSNKEKHLKSIIHTNHTRSVKEAVFYCFGWDLSPQRFGYWRSWNGGHTQLPDKTMWGISQAEYRDL